VINLIDRYISKTFFGFFIAGLIVFVAIFLAVDALSMSVKFPDVAGNIWLKYYSFMSPEILYQMIPSACLLGTLFTLSTLNKNSELVALFASGHSLLRVCAPILVSVLIISGVTFAVGDQILPRFTQQKNFVYFYDIIKRPGSYSTVKTNRIWFRSHNSIYNISTINQKSKTAEGFTLYQFDENWQLLQMITAGKAKIQNKQWELKDGTITLFTEDSSFPLSKNFEKKTVVLEEVLEDIQFSANSTDILSIDDLKKYIVKNKAAGLDTTSFEVGYYAKFAFAFTALVMTLLGIPFGISSSRSGGLMLNIGICLVLVFAYWTLYNTSLTLGYHGTMPPLFAAWGPNILSSALAFAQIRRQRK
jgi:lipopolysaccharide export system permease protein